MAMVGDAEKMKTIEVSINTQAFKWSAKIFMKQRDAEEECGFFCTPAAGMVLIRSTGITPEPEFSFQLYPMIDVCDFSTLLAWTMKKLPALRSCDDLDLIAEALVLRMNYKSMLHEECLGEDPDHTYVMFFDIIDISSSKVVEWPPKVEEIVNLLKSSSEVYILRSSDKMEKARFKKEREEVKFEASCPICMGGICVGDKSTTTTACSHLFHHSCLHDWTISSPKPSCPVCRCSLDISV